MKKQALYLLTAILLIALLACSCNKVPTTESGTPVPTEETVTLKPGTVASPTATTNNEQSELLNLLPKDEGYKWIYNGFVDYSHEMTLESITQDNESDNTIYDIKGMVEDLSDGESNKDFSMSLRYIVGKFTLSQEITGEMVMDSDFESIQLVKLPLEKGSTWEQEVTGQDGSTVNLNCTIKEVSEEDGKKVYTILYQDTDSDYYENRTIMEGMGVIAFEKLYTPNEGEPFEIGYSLFR